MILFERHKGIIASQIKLVLLEYINQCRSYILQYLLIMEQIEQAREMLFLYKKQ